MAAMRYFYGLLINNYACVHVHVHVKTNVKINIIR